MMFEMDSLLPESSFNGFSVVSSKLLFVCVYLRVFRLILVNITCIGV